MTSESDALILPVGPSSRTGYAHVSVPAGNPVGYDPGAWDKTLVMVQQGVLRLTCQSGRDADFPAGAILYLAGLPLASIGSAGHEPVLLLLLSPRPLDTATTTKRSMTTIAAIPTDGQTDKVYPTVS